MLFNSLSFLIFFVVIFIVYYFPLKGNTKAQNVLLLIASYFFYGYASWRMLPLLIVSTVIFYGLGLWINGCKNDKTSSALTTIGVVLGVGILLYFKYLNFFIDSFASMLGSFGLQTNWHSFNIIMPLGVSFFTFKLISYVVEIHRGKVEPTKDFVAFATYISFFPCILAGPIDRPQFICKIKSSRTFNYSLAVDGSRQVLWGLFKKVVIADSLVGYVNNVWADIPGSSGSTLLMSAILYSFQLYTDFSGYSDMAIGIGKLLGFRIARNFNYPFFATNVAEYWRRWHMSLTSWLTDYVFMPLNIKFRDLGKLGIISAIIINMVIVGLWHGANWTFAVFGLYHGLLFIPIILSGAFYKKNKLKTTKHGFPVFQQFRKMVLTFLLVTLGLIIFRAENMGQAVHYLTAMVTNKFFDASMLQGKQQLCFVLLLLFIEWLQRDKQHALQFADIKPFKYRLVRWSVYYVILLVIFKYAGSSQTFVYFQF